MYLYVTHTTAMPQLKVTYRFLKTVVYEKKSGTFTRTSCIVTTPQTKTLPFIWKWKLLEFWFEDLWQWKKVLVNIADIS